MQPSPISMGRLAGLRASLLGLALNVTFGNLD
jgi:hypothetical protein